MKKIAFFDTKPYDRESFDKLNGGRYEIKYFETRLTAAALPLAEGCDADLTVFYPETIRDGATFTDLDIQPEGIEQVYIGGRLALDRKVTVDPRLGRFLSYKDPH